MAFLEDLIGKATDPGTLEMIRGQILALEEDTKKAREEIERKHA